MSKKFLREIQIIKFCRICQVEFRPWRYSWEAQTDLCRKHRYLYYKELYKTHYLFEKTPERKKLKYQVWLKWIKKNYERRRLMALASYHRRKDDPKNKARKHRATKKPPD